MANNRMFLFRGWDKKENKMYEYDHSSPVCFFLIASYHHWEIMQYTGMKDKNGRNIFEGDIIKYKDDYWVCYYEERVAGFRLYPKSIWNEGVSASLMFGKKFVDSNNKKANTYEVVGDVYE